MKYIIITFLAFISVLPQSDSIRCYECRSDVHRSCGDPFVPNRVPAVECSLLSTNPVVMCFKASQSVGGNYVTVRGCAPFNTDHFSRGFQRGMQGTYWNGRNLFSLCDYDNCNAANGVHVSMAVIALALMTKFSV